MIFTGKKKGGDLRQGKSLAVSALGNGRDVAPLIPILASSSWQHPASG